MKWCFLCKCSVRWLGIYGPLFSVCLVFSWVVPYSVKELKLSWLERYGRRYSKGIWLAVPLSLMKCTWHEQNQRFFNSQELSMMKLKFLKSLYE